MALSTVENSIYFHYDEGIKDIKVTDSTDYNAQGTADTNVVVTIKVESPSGVFYNNLSNTSDPDIDPDVSLNSVKLIPLPLDGAGLPEQGLYTITLEYYDSSTPVTITDVKTVTLNYASPTVDISMEADCITPLLTATDDTSYTVNSIAPTVVRDFKIHYPPSIPTADVSGTGASVSTSEFYTVADSTVEHSSSLTSTLTYTLSSDDLIYLIDEVSGSEVIQVACDGDICDIYCCIRSQWNRYQSAKSTNLVLAAQEYKKFEEIIAISSLVGAAVRCGKSSHVSDYVSEILEIADCEAGCACGDGTPQLVTGLAVNGTDVIVSQGLGTSVTATTGAGTKTYTVSLNTENINKLANTYNTDVSAGDNVSSVDVTPSVSGSVVTKTYKVNVDSMYVESIFVKAKFTMNSAAVPTISIEAQKEYGSTFGSVNQTGGTEFVLNNNNASFSDWTTKLTDFTISNFFSAAAVDYFPEVSIVNIVKPTTGSATSWIQDIQANIVEMNSSDFTMRFSDMSGAPISGLAIQDYTSFELIFKIQA